jgi:hypothetical protein
MCLPLAAPSLMIAADALPDVLHIDLFLHRLFVSCQQYMGGTLLSGVPPCSVSDGCQRKNEEPVFRLMCGLEQLVMLRIRM